MLENEGSRSLEYWSTGVMEGWSNKCSHPPRLPPILQNSTPPKLQHPRGGGIYGNLLKQAKRAKN
jgi:hypothetical protein